MKQDQKQNQATSKERGFLKWPNGAQRYAARTVGEILISDEHSCPVALSNSIDHLLSFSHTVHWLHLPRLANITIS